MARINIVIMDRVNDLDLDLDSTLMHWATLQHHSDLL